MTSRWGWMALVAIAMTATPVYGQTSSTGVRAGVSGDPGQFYFGGHVETRPLIDKLTFRPNVEIGLGDDTTLVAGEHRVCVLDSDSEQAMVGVHGRRPGADHRRSQ